MTRVQLMMGLAGKPAAHACRAVFLPAAIGAVMALAHAPALAQSLQCPGGSVAQGDSRLSVAFKCGQPLLADSYCAPVYYTGTLRPVPPPIAGLIVPCQQVDEWLYDRGPGNFMATVRFRLATVETITFGREPR